MLRLNWPLNRSAGGKDEPRRLSDRNEATSPNLQAVSEIEEFLKLKNTYSPTVKRRPVPLLGANRANDDPHAPSEASRKPARPRGEPPIKSLGPHRSVKSGTVFRVAPDTPSAQRYDTPTQSFAGYNSRDAFPALHLLPTNNWFGSPPRKGALTHDSQLVDKRWIHGAGLGPPRLLPAPLGPCDGSQRHQHKDPATTTPASESPSWGTRPPGELIMSARAAFNFAFGEPRRTANELPLPGVVLARRPDGEHRRPVNRRAEQPVLKVSSPVARQPGAKTSSFDVNLMRTPSGKQVGKTLAPPVKNLRCMTSSLRRVIQPDESGPSLKEGAAAAPPQEPFSRTRNFSVTTVSIGDSQQQGKFLKLQQEPGKDEAWKRPSVIGNLVNKVFGAHSKRSASVTMPPSGVEAPLSLERLRTSEEGAAARSRKRAVEDLSAPSSPSRAYRLSRRPLGLTTQPTIVPETKKEPAKSERQPVELSTPKKLVTQQPAGSNCPTTASPEKLVQPQQQYLPPFPAKATFEAGQIQPTALLRPAGLFKPVARSTSLTEFTVSFLLARNLDLVLSRQQPSCSYAVDVELFTEGTSLMIAERDEEFQKASLTGFASGSLEILKAAKLFSQSTFNQACDTQKTSHFSPEGKQEPVQAQLLEHINNSANCRDIISELQQVGLQALGSGIEWTRFTEERRIQNSARRLLEFLLECFVFDICEETPEIVLEADEETKAKIVQWLIKHPGSQIKVLSFIWDSVVKLVPPDDDEHLTVMRRRNDSCDDEDAATLDNSGPSDKEKRTPIVAFQKCLAQLDLLPPELTEDDVGEILQCMQLASTFNQLQFFNQSFERESKYLYERDFLTFFISVPANVPDFPLDQDDITTAVFAESNPLQRNRVLMDLVRQVKNTAEKICRMVTSSQDCADEDEWALARAKISAVNDGMWTGKQVELLLRHPIFCGQDFFNSWVVTLEEVQAALALFENRDWIAFSKMKNESLGSKTAAVQAVLNDALLDLTLAKQRESSFLQSVQNKMPPLKIVQLALEVIVGSTFLHMKASEKYAARDPIGPLAVGIKSEEIVERFRRHFRPGTTISPENFRYSEPTTVAQEPCRGKANGRNSYSPFRGVPSRKYERKIQLVSVDTALQSEMGRRDYGDDLDRKQLATLTQYVGNDHSLSATNFPQLGSDSAKTRMLGKCTAESGELLQIDKDLIQIFLIIQSPSTLMEVSKLFGSRRAPGPAVNFIPKVDLDDPTLHNELDLGAWADFWTQAKEEWSSVNLMGQAGSWGSMKWPSLRQICSVYRHLILNQLL